MTIKKWSKTSKISWHPKSCLECPTNLEHTRAQADAFVGSTTACTPPFTKNVTLNFEFATPSTGLSKVALWAEK